MEGFESFIFRRRRTPEGLGRAALPRPHIHHRGRNNFRARSRVAPSRGTNINGSEAGVPPNGPTRSRSREIVRQMLETEQQIAIVHSLLHEWTIHRKSLYKESALNCIETILKDGHFEFTLTTSEFPVILYRINDGEAKEFYRTHQGEIALELSGVYPDIATEMAHDRKNLTFLGTKQQAFTFENLAHALSYGARLDIRPTALK